MAQIRYFNYQDDDSTFNLNMRLKGVIEHGRYRGFEQKAFVSGLVLTLEHVATGYKHIKEDLTSFAAVGTVVTKQGVCVNETADINITVLANASVLWSRIDTIVLEHNYISTTGGTPAIYKVLQGTPAASPVPAALTDPDKQVILGYLTLPPNTSNLTAVGVTYTQAPVPYFANSSTYFDQVYAAIAALNLNALTDVTITTATNGDVLLYNGSQWVNTNAKNYIQTLQLNMGAYIAENGAKHSSASTNGVNLTGAGANEFGYDIGANLIQWNLAASSVRKISHLTNAQFGTVVRMQWAAGAGTHAGLVMNGVGTGFGAPILDSNGRTGTIAIRSGVIYMFVKMDVFWLLIEEMPRANYTQTDPNALDFIQNKPAAFVQTKANWTQNNPALDSYIQNRPNVMEVVGRFTLSVGNVGALTIGNAVTVVNNGGFPVQASSATVAGNTGGNTQQNSSITVNLVNTGSINYLGYFVIYSNGVTADDALAYPTMKFITFTSFNLGLREVATNVTSNVTVEVILIKSPIAL